ncbi:MAG: TIGR03086 family metal-binding protein [Acidimicrobiales bacterium]
MIDDHPSDHPDDRTLLDLAHTRFATSVTSLADGDTTRPTGCPPWTVADLIDHVGGGAVMAAALIGGGAAAEARDVRATWTRRPLTAERLRVALALEAAAFDAADPAAVVDHPVMPMTAADLLGQRLIEYVVHDWDLRQACGDHAPVDEVLVRRAWQLAAPLAPFAADLGVFGAGPSPDLPADADDLARLLDLTGRRPADMPPATPAPVPDTVADTTTSDTTPHTPSATKPRTTSVTTPHAPPHTTPDPATSRTTTPASAVAR